MKSPIRLFFILPIIIFSLIALMQFIFNSFFVFTLWAFVAFIAFIICYPIITNSEMKYVPIHQIFPLFLGLLVVFGVASFFDIIPYFTKDKAIILSVFASLFVTGFVMFLHNIND